MLLKTGQAKARKRPILPSEGRGREFESRRVRHILIVSSVGCAVIGYDRFPRQFATEAPRENGDPFPSRTGSRPSHDGYRVFRSVRLR
jgi:hypothetical protein